MPRSTAGRTVSGARTTCYRSRPVALSDEQSRPPAVKRLLQKAARVVGLHVGRYPPVDSLAYHLKTVLRELAIDCVLNVEAHEGEFAALLRDLDYTGQIISFEPVRSSFDALTRKRAFDKAWTAQNIALGADDGEFEMNICSGSVFNSFLKPAENGSSRFGAATEVVRTEKVPMRRLEGVIDEILAARP